MDKIRSFSIVAIFGPNPKVLPMNGACPQHLMILNFSHSRVQLQTRKYQEHELLSLDSIAFVHNLKVAPLCCQSPWDMVEFDSVIVRQF